MAGKTSTRTNKRTTRGKSSSSKKGKSTSGRKKQTTSKKTVSRRSNVKLGNKKFKATQSKSKRSKSTPAKKVVKKKKHNTKKTPGELTGLNLATSRILGILRNNVLNPGDEYALKVLEEHREKEYYKYDLLPKEVKLEEERKFGGKSGVVKFQGKAKELDQKTGKEKVKFTFLRKQVKSLKKLMSEDNHLKEVLVDAEENYTLVMKHTFARQKLRSWDQNNEDLAKKYRNKLKKAKKRWKGVHPDEPLDEQQFNLDFDLDFYSKGFSATFDENVVEVENYDDWLSHYHSSKGRNMDEPFERYKTYLKSRKCQIAKNVKVYLTAFNEYVLTQMTKNAFHNALHNVQRRDSTGKKSLKPLKTIKPSHALYVDKEWSQFNDVFPLHKLIALLDIDFNKALEDVDGDKLTKDEIKEYVNGYLGDKEYVIFNSHITGLALQTKRVMARESTSKTFDYEDGMVSAQYRAYANLVVNELTTRLGWMMHDSLPNKPYKKKNIKEETFLQVLKQLHRMLGIDYSITSSQIKAMFLNYKNWMADKTPPTPVEAPATSGKKISKDKRKSKQVKDEDSEPDDESGDESESPDGSDKTSAVSDDEDSDPDDDENTSDDDYEDDDE